MDTNVLLPLMMSMMGGGKDGAPDYSALLNALGKGGGNINAANYNGDNDSPGSGNGGGNNGPDYGAMMSALVNGGGDPMSMLLGMMGNGDPRMKQMLTLVQAMQSLNKGGSTGNGNTGNAKENASGINGGNTSGKQENSNNEYANAYGKNDGANDDIKQQKDAANEYRKNDYQVKDYRTNSYGGNYKVNGYGQGAPEQTPINELRPIKHIAPDHIHNSMDEYFRNYNR